MKEVLMNRGPSRATAGQPEQGPRFSTSILEKAGFSVVVADLEGKITYWNKRAEEMRGWRSEEVIGRPIFYVIPAESRELANSIMTKIAKSGSWTGESEAIRKDGTRFQTMSSMEALEDWNGRVVGMIEVSIEVTERTQMEKRLRDSETKFRGIAERSFDGIFTLDMGGILTYASPAFAKLFGYDQTEVIGRSLAEHIPESEPESERIKLAQAFADISSGGIIDGLQIEARRRDGSPIFVWVNAAPMLDEGRVVGFQGVVRDLTLRREMAKRLHDTEEKFKGITERSFDGIFTTDAKGVYTYVSPSFAKLFGLDPTEMTGKSILERAHLRLQSESDRSRFAQIFKDVLRGNPIEAGQFEIRRADGSMAFVEANASPVLEGGKVTGVQAVVRDITKRIQAEDELHFQASLLNQVGHSVITVDRAGIVTYWNRQSEELFGLKREEAIGKSAKKVMAVLDPNSLVEGVLKALLQSGNWTGEIEFSRKNGAHFPAMVTANAIKNSSGLVVGHSFVSLDITERKETEKRLHESEEKFRGIAERSFDGIFLLDANGSLTYASPSLCRILGSKPKDVIGQSLTKYLPAHAIPAFTQAFGELMRGGTIEGFETEGKKNDGSPLLLQVSASSVFVDGYSVTGIQGVLRDVTELRRAEEPKKLLASVVESSPIGMMSIGLGGSITAWNPAAERIYGLSPKEVLGRPVSVLESPEDATDAGRIIERLTNGEKVVHFESVRPKKDGSLFNISVDAFLIRDLSGKVIGFSSFFSDITAQKVAEEKVRNLQEVRSKFISAATHELKTPLVSIKGYADLALSGSLGEVSKPLKHGLEVVGRNVERMLNLIQELLEIERMDNGKMEISKEVVDLTDVIRESIDNLRPVAEGKKLEVDVVLPDAPPRVTGDKARLDEVMDNLLVNAIKFTPVSGKLRVVIAEEAGLVRVSVADTGIGIDPTNLANLFEPFSKIPKAGFVDDQQIYGLYSTGLGLAVTKRLVELHGGRIWAESPGEGQGSTFIFTLPSIPH